MSKTHLKKDNTKTLCGIYFDYMKAEVVELPEEATCRNCRGSSSTPPTPNGVVSDELREEIEGYFKALGMADAFDYERFLKEYVDAIMLIITQQTTAARIEAIKSYKKVLKLEAELKKGL